VLLGMSIVLGGCATCGDGIPCGMTNPWRGFQPPPQTPTCSKELLSIQNTNSDQVVIKGIDRLASRARANEFVVVDSIDVHRTRVHGESRATKPKLNMSLWRESGIGKSSPKSTNLDKLVSYDLAQVPAGFIRPGEQIDILRGTNYHVQVRYSIHGSGTIRYDRECLDFNF